MGETDHFDGHVSKEMSPGRSSRLRSQQIYWEAWHVLWREWSSRSVYNLDRQTQCLWTLPILGTRSGMWVCCTDYFHHLTCLKELIFLRMCQEFWFQFYCFYILQVWQIKKINKSQLHFHSPLPRFWSMQCPENQIQQSLCCAAFWQICATVQTTLCHTLHSLVLHNYCYTILEKFFFHRAMFLVLRKIATMQVLIKQMLPATHFFCFNLTS